MAKKKPQIFENVEITDIAAEGKSIAKVNELVLFVDGAIPGDVADLKVTKRKKNYREAIPIKYHKYSVDRVKPFCNHFGTCGGCKWQQLPYEKQIFYKQKQIVDSLERIAKVSLPKIDEIIPSERTLYYRNKLEFTFSCRKWLTPDEVNSDDGNINFNALGYHKAGMFDRVLNVDHCWLQSSPSNRFREAVKEFTLANNYVFYDHRKKNGLMRNVIIRTSAIGETMIIITFNNDDTKRREDLFQYLVPMFPEITSWNYVINSKVNDSIADLPVHLYLGREFIYEKMENLYFKVGPKSFYQTNAEQAYKLYDKTREFAKLTGDEIVYDLYTGTGTIANFIAFNAKKVVGIEFTPEAIEDAKENSKINNITNTTFFAGDMRKVLTDEFVMLNGKPDIIIADPPRAGMHPDVVNVIIRTAPKKIIYVSCNPATQARDINLMGEFYKITRVQPVDMFPHTHHVENIVLLERTSDV